MSSKTKIVVLHMKEVVYTGIFLMLAVILAIVLFFMFGPGKARTGADPRYKPGVYTSSIELSGNTFDVAVTVDSQKIKRIRLNNLSESTAAMFPLMEPALESLADQIYTAQSLEDIKYADDRKYTTLVLLNSIEEALKKAENH